MSDGPLQIPPVFATGQTVRADAPAAVAAARPRGVTLKARLTRRPLLFEALGAVIAMALALAIAVVALKLWDAGDLRVPLVWGGDMPSLLAVIKGLRETGWIYSNPALGAPTGEHLYDFGSLGFDDGSWVIIRAMTLVAASPGTVINAYFL